MPRPRLSRSLARSFGRLFDRLFDRLLARSLAAGLGFAFSVFFSCAASAAPLLTAQSVPESDAAIIENVRKTRAPDPRTTLFEATARTEGGLTVLEGRTDSPEALSDLRASYYLQKRAVDVRVKLLPDSDALKKKVWAFTTAPLADIADPATGRIVARMPAGTPAARLDEKDGQTLLRLPDGSIGLAKSADVRPCTETEILIRNRHEKLVVTAAEAVFRTLAQEGEPSVDVALPRGAVLRLDGEDAQHWRAALPDNRRGTLPKAGVEKLLDVERRFENARREDPAAFMKSIAETARREARSGCHADGAAFLRAVFFSHDLIVQRDPDMLLAAYPKVSGGKARDRFKAGDILIFRSENGVTTTGISLGGSRFASVPDMGGDFRAGSAQARAKLRRALEGAVRIDPGFLNDPCLTSTRSNPYWQAPVKALVPCSRRSEIDVIR